jgi:two-component system chemotaxis sensor kinase CheA
MSDEGLPEEFLQRYRQAVAERLTRAESLWFSLLQGTGHDAEAAELLRVVHTLKGDAGVVGFTDVHLVCHELEELLDVAKAVAYAVPDDIDLLVTMSFHFIGLLARRPVGSSVAGIDLAGFVQEVDQAVRATRAIERFAAAGSPRSAAAGAPDDQSPDQETRLARAASMAFLEHLGAHGAARERLHVLWRLLRQEVAQSSSSLLHRLVERHVAAADELSEQLGKLVGIEVETHGLCVTRRTADALDVALLHSVRNAVDHGLEPPHERTAAGKPPRGLVRITATMEGDVVELVVEDDGRGLDHAAIVERAIEAGLVAESVRSSASSLDVQELVFRPGFTTAKQASRVSGRGVGLDAARAALGKVGGEISARPREGGGTRIAMRVPALVHHMQVHVFDARPGVPLAVPATWAVTSPHDDEPNEPAEPAEPADAEGPPVDPLEALGIAERAASPPEHVLTLRRGPSYVCYVAASLPRLVTAQRICPTTANDPLEVVLVHGQEVLVVRPDALATGTSAAARRSGP